MQDCRDWVRSRLLTRGAKPFEFVQTVPCYDPSQSASNSCFSGKGFEISDFPFNVVCTLICLHEIGLFFLPSEIRK